jgi:CMP-N-acetylneuraminic acid synthetase
MNILITICARDGSKGVPKKNFRLFFGKPLIFYTMRFATDFKQEFKETYSIDVVVSSNSREIKAIVDEFGLLDYIDRPEAMSQDDSAKIPVIRHATECMERIYHKKYEYVIDLDVTAPLRVKSELNSIITKAIEKNSKVIMTAVKSRRNPYFNMVELNNGLATKVKPSEYYYRQAAPPSFDLSPSIYLFHRDTLVNKLQANVFEVDCEIFEITDRYVIDIDNQMDFTVLETLITTLYYDEFKDLFRD